LQHWEGRGKEVTGELSQGAPGSGMEDTQRLLGVTLPPSPPLTNREVDPEADGFDSIHTHSQTAPENEEDIATAWRTSHEQHPIPSSSTRPSHDVPRPSLKDPLRHPLEDPNPISPSSVIEFEKGQDPPQDDEDLKPVMGVTKPFEIIRPSQQPLSVPKPPKSSYYMGPPLGPSVYGTPPVGQLGLHHPREIVRIERDYDNGELVQFSSAYPMELQGRITPTVFLETINVLNETLIKAYSVSGAAIYNVLAVLTLWISPLFIRSRYDKEMERLALIIDQLNAEIYNPVGLNILWPRKSAFLFVSGDSPHSFLKLLTSSSSSSLYTVGNRVLCTLHQTIFPILLSDISSPVMVPTLTKFTKIPSVPSFPT